MKKHLVSAWSRVACAGLAAFALVVLTGCAGPAPNYSASIDNVETLKKSGAQPLRTGAITPAPDLKTAASIGIRAATMVSGTGSHFGDYLASALRQELELAKLYDPRSDVEIAGTLIQNDINAGGITTNDGVIEARLRVIRQGQVRFDKQKLVRHEWPGAFAGSTAVPNAANNYPIMVQKLISQFVQDPDFQQALRP